MLLFTKTKKLFLLNSLNKNITLILVMEQTKARKAHCHAVSVAGINHILIPDRAARLCHIFYTATVCSVDIIAEWEESI